MSHLDHSAFFAEFATYELPIGLDTPPKTAQYMGMDSLTKQRQQNSYNAYGAEYLIDDEKRRYEAFRENSDGEKKRQLIDSFKWDMGEDMQKLRPDLLGSKTSIPWSGTANQNPIYLRGYWERLIVLGYGM